MDDGETYVVDDNDFSCSEELLRNDKAADGVCDTPAGVANNMGITFFEPEGASRVWKKGVNF